MHFIPGLPLPQPDREAYDANLQNALASSEKLRLNYLRFQDHARTELLDILPTKLDFENVSRCNFRCPSCPVSGWEKGRRASDMQLEDFKGIVDELGTLVEIKIQGLGEPLLGGDTYFEMIRFARSRHIWVRTTTNASLLHARDNAARLIDSDVNEVQVSVDGANRETFQAIRVGSRFEQVRRNCVLLNGICRKRGILRTRMWVVVQRLNAGEMVNLVELGAELVFPRITFALDMHGWGMGGMRQSNSEKLVPLSQIADNAHRSVERGRELGAQVSFWQNTAKYSFLRSEGLCPWPFERAFVSSDLRVVPCCMISDPGVLDLGDARSLGAVWNSEAYRSFREAHMEGRIPGPCRMCYSYHS
jgi:pyrroloquinoline quinone biosynthesis protein E